MESSTASGEPSGLVPNHLAQLVPSFDPSKDELTSYTQKVQLLMNMWPDNKWTELSTRLILNCQGSAFKKLQLHQKEVMKNERKSIQRLIEILGGHWGQINLEKQYEYAERALYRCQQKADESADSYLARADILWTELTTQTTKIEDLQAYVTLRGSQLSSDDKKRVLLDADAAGSGKLSLEKVHAAIKMLGAGFFHDVTGVRKSRGKTYDQTTLLAEGTDVDESSSIFMVENAEEIISDDVVDTLFQEGDEDAVLITEFEQAASEILQNDEDLASALNSYTEARRRLTEKTRFRGFWPVQQSKGKNKGYKGAKGKFGKNRKSLQQRILESRCRICDKIGHWKAECPQLKANQSSESGARGNSLSAPTTFVRTEAMDNLPLEFLHLPEASPTIDDPRFCGPECFVNVAQCDLFVSRGRLKDSHQSKVSETKQPMHQHMPRNEPSELSVAHQVPVLQTATDSYPSDEGDDIACFATFGCHGVVDLGATKTVIGSNLVRDLIFSLHPEIQKKLKRCPCKVTFRFGNLGFLHSEQALVVPVQGYQLKIAIVPGSTPFLLSNTLLRTLGAVIDTEKKMMHSRKVNRSFPLHLTPKGLFLLDLNDLASSPECPHTDEASAETHVATESKTPDPLQSHPREDDVIDDEQKVNRFNDHETNMFNNPLKGMNTSQEHDRRSFSPSPQPIAEAIHLKSSNFARSFQVPFVHSHDRLGTKVEERSGQGRDSTAVIESSVVGPARRVQDQLWTDPCREDLQNNVGERAGLHHLVCGPLSQLPEGRSSHLPEVHRADDRSCRVDGTACPSDLQQSGDAAQDSTSRRHSWQGQWETLPKEQDQDSASGCPNQCRVLHGSIGTPRRRGVHRDHSCPEQRRVPSGTKDAALGKCIDQGDPSSRRDVGAPAGQFRRAMTSDVMRPEFSAWLSAGDVSSECMISSEEKIIHSKESETFIRLLQTISQEFQDLKKTHSNNHHVRSDLLEVFCGEASQMTHQCQQLGFRAHRFGKTQGDLSTSDGRRMLFQHVLTHRPKQIWFAPTCGPWSAWSNLNESKSVGLWDKIHQQRIDHLYQVALGIVLFRHQKSQYHHFHWEQPLGSMMFRLPWVSEIHHYLVPCVFDMCTAGHLRDPVSGKFMRKSMMVLTTMPSLASLLRKYRCSGQHDHQQIEGTTEVQGKCVNRSTFSENYPRKFARLVVSHICRLSVQKDLLFAVETVHTAKRRKLDPTARSKLSRTLDVQQVPWGKRVRLIGKTTPVDAIQQWEKVFTEVNAIVPRVGKVHITNQDIIDSVQQLVPDRIVHRVVACRGSSRTLAPPDDLVKGEAPFRKSVFTLRNENVIKTETEWENWEDLSQRQLIRPSHATRINITIFAGNPNSTPSVTPATLPANADQSHQKLTNLDEVPLTDMAGLVPSQQVDIRNPQQPESFKMLSSEEQSTLVRCHKNLGHPSPERLSTVLRQQGYRPAIAKAALEYKCSICQSSVAPKNARPCTLRDDLDFNDRVCIDGLSWTNSQGKTHHMYHMVDWSTNFQVACIAPSRKTEDAITAIINMWFSWAGAPGEMLVDAGTEFNSEEFGKFAQQHGIKVTTTSVEAPFQNGKAERHGAVLKHMLSKFEKDHPIHNYQDLQQAIWWCVQAKNACSLKRGYAPEVLVLGKQTRLPGSVCSDETLPSHLLAEAETAHGIRFRQQLAYREAARKAFHAADNDSALRRSMLRRSHPHRGSYSPGEWVMIWREGKGDYPGSWNGPMRVVVHESQQTIWTTAQSKLYRVAPEHVRPVTALEAQNIQVSVQDNPISVIAQQLTSVRNQGVIQAHSQDDGSTPTIEVPTPPSGNDTNTPNAENPPSVSDAQPDDEPGAPSTADSEGHEVNPSSSQVTPPESAAHVPIPDDDDELICDSLICVDPQENVITQVQETHGWKCEILVSEHDIRQWTTEDDPTELAFVVSAAKRQRAEVKLSQLTECEKAEFTQAKQTEIRNWLSTGTVSKILRDKIPHEQILKCRWILTWKPIDSSEENSKAGVPGHKAKARLVILGYLDPQLENLPRDSPTLGKNSKMLLLQMIASSGWTLKSFDIKAAFLQGKPQQNRVLGVEPVPEMVQMLQMKPNEVCKLEKGAYGLVDAPYLWYQAILEELLKLGFSQSPFDPCVFILRNPNTQCPDGIIGLHVDDGLCGGNSRFDEILHRLEQKYPFGSKKVQKFTFTGIEMTQNHDKSITLSQSKYVRAIEPIHIPQVRRQTPLATVSEEERQALRALIGSLQYASVHTRPDISCRLSFLQSDINRATIETLVSANQCLYEAKKHHDVCITIQAIYKDDVRFLAFSDASFASKSNPSSHSGSIIMSTHKDINCNTTCPVSPLSWGSRKIQRVVTSTLAAETVSLGSVLDRLSWTRLNWGWMLNPGVQWKRPSEALKQLPSSISTATMSSPPIPDSVAATDCKSLYDLVTRTAPPQCSEFRTQLAARAIKDLLSEGTSLRWVHSGAQLADSLTKIMESSFLRETLRVGQYKLHDENEVLKSRATTRNRIKWLKSNTAQDDTECNSV